MTGLEKILSEIETRAERRCAEAEARAEAVSDKILAEAKQKADAECAEILQKAEQQAELLRRADEAERRMQARKAELALKTAAISSVLSETTDILKQLPKKEYFDILKTLALQHCAAGEGEICFSAADTKRLPQSFISSLNTAASEKGAKLILGEPCNIESGCVLRYGNIDINCSFEAVLAERQDEIRDALYALLFPKTDAGA